MKRKSKVTQLKEEHVAKERTEATENGLFHGTFQFSLSGDSVPAFKKLTWRPSETKFLKIKLRINWVTELGPGF